MPLYSARLEKKVFLFFHSKKNLRIYALQNATSATALIQTLQSSAPKPFLGRNLRYEPARAFRTLLVSYR